MAGPSHPPRRRLVGVSFKMYFTLAQTTGYIVSLQNRISRVPPTTDVFVVPDFLSFPRVAAPTGAPTSPSSSSSSPYPSILLGAQNCAARDFGPLTGEVSPANLAALGVQLVELGHAERRRYFGEDDAGVAAKAALVVRRGMVPLVCVGEVGRVVHDDGAAAAAVAEVECQLAPVLDAVEEELGAAAVENGEGEGTAVTTESGNKKGTAEIVVAYEPVWAIGAAEPAPAEHVVRVAAGIRRVLDARQPTLRARILYGGSAGPGLWARLRTAEKEIGVEALDGLFLGRCAHDIDRFMQTVTEVSRH